MPPKPENPKNTDICCLLGLPDHQGVMNVGGRIGAARGPEAFRKPFKRLKSRSSASQFCKDLGDLQGLTEDVAHNHRIAAEWIEASHKKYPLSIVVGGGHDHGHSHLWGMRKKSKRLGCINIDAHLDVRKPDPLITSGSPFFLALESGVLDAKNFIEFGIQSHCNAPELWDYVKSKKIEVIPMTKLRRGRAVPGFLSALRKLQTRCDAIVISLDLDSITEASAPGVSAPQSEGFSPSEILEMMEIAGSSKKVVSLGIFELNPVFDPDERTARLAAVAAHHFLESALTRLR